MSKQNKIHIAKLGNEVYPYERLNFVLTDTEEDTIFFGEFIHDASNGSKPDAVILVNPCNLIAGDQFGKYLWIIDQLGLKLILEAIPNPDSKRKVVCHSNITGGGLAFQAGELWFGQDGVIYLNFRSGRYGANNNEQKGACISYFHSIGYKQIIIID